MIAYHNDSEIKTKYLERVAAHRAADELLTNYGYWKDGKGCAVGCTIHGSDHAAYETELGIPRELAHLEDHLFESLSQAKALKWPERFLSAIKPGADLSGVADQFKHWLLVDDEHGVINYVADDHEEVQEIVRRVAGYLAEGATDDEWSAAESAARSAAELAVKSAAELAVKSAARSAARSAAESATWSAARSAARSVAESAVRSAARSAAWSAAESAVRSAAITEQANQLIELLEAA